MSGIRVRALGLAAALCLGGGVSLPAGAQDNGEYGGLPAGEGRDVVYAVCDGCHSIRLVQQQGMSRTRWAKTLEWMVEEQGMPELDPETRETVLDYLADNFGEAQRGEAGAVSPFNRVQPLQPAPR